MKGPRTPKPSPLVGEGAEPHPNSGLPEFGTLKLPKSDTSDFGCGEAGEGGFASIDTGVFAANPSPGRSPSGGAVRRPAGSRPPSPTRGRGYRARCNAAAPIHAYRSGEGVALADDRRRA